MQAAVSLGSFFLICGVAALLDVPAVQFNGQAVAGVGGFVSALAAAAVPPLVVLVWRKMSRS